MRLQGCAFDFSCSCVSFASGLVSMCVCCGEVGFYSHIYIHTAALYSTLLPKHRPQLSLFPVHPQRSYSWQKTHQVGRTTDNWGDDRSCSKTIDSDGDRGSGELSRLTELSGGSRSARPECGITHSIDTAALLAKKKYASTVSLFFFFFVENLSEIFSFQPNKRLFSASFAEKSYRFFSLATAALLLAARPPRALLIAQIPSTELPQSHSNILN